MYELFFRNMGRTFLARCNTVLTHERTNCIQEAIFMLVVVSFRVVWNQVYYLVIVKYQLSRRISSIPPPTEVFPLVIHLLEVFKSVLERRVMIVEIFQELSFLFVPKSCKRDLVNQLRILLNTFVSFPRKIAEQEFESYVY